MIELRTRDTSLQVTDREMSNCLNVCTLKNELNMYIKIAYGVLTDTRPAEVLNMCANIRQLCKANSSYPLILIH
jgi:hypothetical protein